MGERIACECDCSVRGLSAVFLVVSKFFLHSSRTCPKKRKEETKKEDQTLSVELNVHVWKRGQSLKRLCVWCVSKDNCVSSSLLCSFCEKLLIMLRISLLLRLCILYAHTDE